MVPSRPRPRKQPRTCPNDRRARTGLCHACHPRRRPARSGNRRAHHADLPDHVLCVRRCRSRRLAVQPGDLRQHLFAHHEPDPGGAGGAGRGARRRHRGAGGGLGPRRAAPGVPHFARHGRRVHLWPPALWRLDQPVQPRLQEVRLERGLGGQRRPLLVRARALAQDQGDLHRVRSPIQAASSSTSPPSPLSRRRPACR